MTYPWKDRNGRTSPLKLTVFVALFVPALWVAVAFAFGWLGSRPLERGDPSARPVDDPPHLSGARGHAAAPYPAMVAAAGRAPDDRRRCLCLRDRPSRALRHRPGLRPRQDRDRDRAADLSDDRLCRSARAGGARRDLDRRHDPASRRPTLAAAAPARLRDRAARGRAFLHAVEARPVGADGHGRALCVADLLSAAGAAGRGAFAALASSGPHCSASGSRR